MTRHIVAFFVSVLSVAPLFAQEWVAATVVSSAGDTLRGEIRFEDMQASPGRFEYRNNAEGRVTTLNVEVVTSYTINDTKASFDAIELPIAYYASVPVEAGANPIVRQDTIGVFADVLWQSASTTLYQFTDEMGQYRFVLRKGNVLTELRNVSFTVLKDDRVHRQDRPVYRNQIKALFPACNINTDALQYNEKDLTRMMRSVAACNGETVVKSRTSANASTVGLGISAGAGVIFGKPGSNYNVGLQVQLIPTRGSRTSFFWFEFGVTNYNYEDESGGSFPYIKILSGRSFGDRQVRGLIFGGFSFPGGVTGGFGARLGTRFAVYAKVEKFLVAPDGTFTLNLSFLPLQGASK